jgi:O-antigen/teichoic acid export membrane protein
VHDRPADGSLATTDLATPVERAKAAIVTAAQGSFDAVDAVVEHGSLDALRALNGRLMRLGGINLAGGMARAVLQVVLMASLVRIAGAAVVGEYVIAAAVAGMLVLFDGGVASHAALVGARMSQPQSRAARTDAAASLALVWCIGVGVFCVGALASAIVAPLLFESPSRDHRWLLTVAVAGVGPRMALNVATQLLQGSQLVARANSLATAALTGQAILQLGVAVNGGGAVGLMVAAVVPTAIVAALARPLVLVRVLGPLPGIVLPSRRKAAQLVRAGRPFLLLSVSSVVFSQLDRLVVGVILGPAHVAIYAALTAAAIQVNQVAALLAQPLLALSAGASLQERRHLFARSVGLVSRAMGVVAGVALATGGWWATIVMGEPVPAAASAAVVVAYASMSLAAPAYFLLIGAGQTRRTSHVQIVVTGLSLLAVTLGAVFGGLTGAAVGNLTSVGLLWLFVDARRSLSLPGGHDAPPTRHWRAWSTFAAIVAGGLVMGAIVTAVAPMAS